MADKEKKTVSAGTTVNKQANQFKNESTVYLNSLRQQLSNIRDTDSHEIMDMIKAIDVELNARKEQTIQEKIQRAHEIAREQEKNAGTAEPVEAQEEKDEQKPECHLAQQLHKEREYQKELKRAHEETDILYTQDDKIVGHFFKQVFDTFSVFYYVYGKLYNQLQVRKVYLSKESTFVENTTADIRRFTKLAEPSSQEEFNDAQAKAAVTIKRAQESTNNFFRSMFGEFHHFFPLGLMW